MKLRFFGTCSGTEPMPGLHHTSFAVEAEDRLYLFDAGENCAYTAYLSGADVLSTKAIFISHCHIDHTGGLANYIAVMTKMENRTGRRASPVKLCIQQPEVWDAVRTLCGVSEGVDPAKHFSVADERLHDGLIYDDSVISVTALHNTHLAKREKAGEKLSFSFRIESGGKAVVFSGDTKTYEEIYPLFEGGCDLALCETGHHIPADVAVALEGKTDAIGFIHHGRRILADAEGEAKIAREKFSGKITVFRDGDVLEV